MKTTFLRRLAADDTGATAIEYALIAGLISIVLIAGATLIGTELVGMFTSVDSAI